MNQLFGRMFNIAKNINVIQKRKINLQEFQCKKLMMEHDINVQKFCVVNKLSDMQNIKSNFKVNEYVIKAQITAGGRGKGVFTNGFKGGVHLTKDSCEMERFVVQMLGNCLKTKQTPPDGILVNSVMVAEALNIQRETYFAILMDRLSGSPLLVACAKGGVDIEELAAQCPDAIFKEAVDPIIGITEDQAQRVALKLGFNYDTKLFKSASIQIQNLYKMFKNLDCTQVEVNPFCETVDGRVVSFDAKLSFDPNAMYRQPAIRDLLAEVQSMELAGISDPTNPLVMEADAIKNGLTFVGFANGNIGCIVNGAGLAMATMDLIHRHGGRAANFLDLGGNASREHVQKALQILMKNPSITCILVNIFGGIINCELITDGLLNTMRDQKIQIPIVVRLQGTNVKEALRQLNANGRSHFTTVDHFDKAASLAVSMA